MSGPALRCGVVGVGSLGRHHARKVVDHPEAELVGVFDPDSERAQAVADEVASRTFPDAEALLDEVEAVIVAAPTEHHGALGERALHAGVHLLMEKPLATTLTEADRLLEAAEQGGRVLQVGHLTRFHPGVQRLAEQGLDRSPPRYVEANRLNPFQPRSLDIDVILDLMVHDLDLLLHWIPAPVTEVRALGVPLVTDKVDMANARLAFANGAVANVTASRVARKRLREVRLFQPRRYVSLDFAGGAMGVYEVDGSQDSGAIPGVRGEGTELPEADLLAQELAAFVAACRGQPSRGVPGSEGRAALALGLDVRAAVEDHFARYGPSMPADEANL